MNGQYQQPKKFLIVDDEIFILEIVAAMLKSIFNGESEIYSAESGQKALEIAKTLRIDQVFMDIQMPHMNGLETLRELKKMDSSISIVMMTGGAPQGMIDAALAHGAEDCLRKPFTREDIKNYLVKKSFISN